MLGSKTCDVIQLPMWQRKN